MEVKIYSTSTCPYCTLAKEYLTSKGISFQSIDVSADKTASEEMIKISGQMGVPVIVAGDEVIVGFDKGAINKSLNL
ncbi:MAG: glutathione S-transferase N-terminal domain-containing protein [Candidatus Omnitrophica bacterium]|nr:glutathione S-transferase N-terminal domain-containing protein [Candidatus Omnitrophota bacterium]